MSLLSNVSLPSYGTRFVQALLILGIMFSISPSVAHSNSPDSFKESFSMFRNLYLQSAFHNMTDPQHYLKFVRPNGDCQADRQADRLASRPLAVNMSLELYNYATVDEMTSEYTFQFFLDLEWCDERLILAESDANSDIADGQPEMYHFVEGGQHHIDRIWHPSIFVANNEQAGSIDFDQQSSNMIRIDINSGRIWLRKRKLLHIYCLMDFSLFPFDRQHCSVHFESNVDTYQNLRMSWRDLFIDRKKQAIAGGGGLSRQIRVRQQNYDEEMTDSVVNNPESFHTIGFELVDIHLSSSIVAGLSGANFSRCSFDFTLQREFVHHLMLTYLPSALIVIVSWTTFWLEITSPPARVLLGVTTMLALITNFKLTRDQLPTISYLNVLDIWNLVCTTFITLSLIEFAAVNFIYNTAKRRKLLRRIKQRSEKYKRAHHENAQASQTIGNLQSNKTPLEESINRFLTERDHSSNQDSIEIEIKPKESLARMASINSMIMKRDGNLTESYSSSTNSHAELIGYSNLAERETLADEKSHPLVNRSVSFIQSSCNFTNEPNRPPTPRVPRKFTPNKQHSVPETGQPPLKRFNSGESTFSSVNGPTNRTRRKSLLISSNVAVVAIFELTPEQLAHKIDHWSRYLFPSAFTLFNLLYWTVVLIRKSNSQAPKW